MHYYHKRLKSVSCANGSEYCSIGDWLCFSPILVIWCCITAERQVLIYTRKPQQGNGCVGIELSGPALNAWKSVTAWKSSGRNRDSDCSLLHWRRGEASVTELLPISSLRIASSEPFEFLSNLNALVEGELCCEKGWGSSHVRLFHWSWKGAAFFSLYQWRNSLQPSFRVKLVLMHWLHHVPWCREWLIEWNA